MAARPDPDGHRRRRVPPARRPARGAYAHARSDPRRHLRQPHAADRSRARTGRRVGVEPLPAGGDRPARRPAVAHDVRRRRDEGRGRQLARRAGPHRCAAGRRVHLPRSERVGACPPRRRVGPATRCGPPLDRSLRRSHARCVGRPGHDRQPAHRRHDRRGRAPRLRRQRVPRQPARSEPRRGRRPRRPQAATVVALARRARTGRCRSSAVGGVPGRSHGSERATV